MYIYIYVYIYIYIYTYTYVYIYRLHRAEVTPKDHEGAGRVNRWIAEKKKLDVYTYIDICR